MQRVLGVAVVVLAALVVIQAVALRRNRWELAQARAWAAAVDLDTRRDEILRTGQWLHTWLQSPEGGSRVEGLCPQGAPDVDTLRALVFGTYVHARATGATEPAARDVVAGQARR